MSEHTFIRLLIPVLLAIVYRDNDETLRHGSAKPNRVWLSGSDPPLGWPAVAQGVPSARSPNWLRFGGGSESILAAGYGVSWQDLLVLFIGLSALLIRRALLEGNCVSPRSIPLKERPYSSELSVKFCSDITSHSGLGFREMDGSHPTHGEPATPDQYVIRYEDSNDTERQGSLPTCQAGNANLSVVDRDLHDTGSDVCSERSIDDGNDGSSSDTTVEHEESMCLLPGPTVSGHVDKFASAHGPDEATPRAARLASSTGIAGQDLRTAGLTISIPRLAPSGRVGGAQFSASCVCSPGSSLHSVSGAGFTTAPGFELSAPGTCLSRDSFEHTLAHVPVPALASRIHDRNLDPALVEGIRSLIVWSHARPVYPLYVATSQEASTTVEMVDQLRERHADLSAIQRQFDVCRARLQNPTPQTPGPVRATHLKRLHGRIARLSGRNT